MDHFQTISTKNFAYKSNITMLVSLALSEIGKEKVTQNEIAIITSILLKEDKSKIKGFRTHPCLDQKYYKRYCQWKQPINGSN